MAFLRHAGLVLALVAANFATLAIANQSSTPSDWQMAAQTLFARFDSAESKSELSPRLSNPDDAILIRSVLDGDAIWSMAGQDFPAIDARCEPVRALMTRYLLRGSHPAPDQIMGPDQLRGSADNWKTYSDEASLSFATATLCGVRETEAIGKFMLALTPEQDTSFRRHAALGGRASLTQSIWYLIGMQTEARSYTSLANRRLLLATLARVAPTLAPLLSLEERASIRDALDAQIPQVADVDREAMLRIRPAFEITKCTGFCAMKAD